ncbi:Kinesin [Phytophthora megakarya]|uniref:Kinesin n=1 Tax=Phytophthora megakarya TaxID=4795 RepID=A0A225WAV8_9STRA|nr:Kinesin [Phytophthora megakarya]
MELVDYQGTLLVQCSRCAIRVHVKCYGVSIEGGEASSWLCQACGALRLTDQSGALRLTDQSDVWCHVLCINWIPELYHSLAGAMDEAVQISNLDRSRSSLRCVVCGLRGGCIQCVSGRCAKAFHVLCAFRSPSSLVFTGYNTENQQVYHCKTHLSDVATTKFEMVDSSWWKFPETTKYVAEHPPTSEAKCRYCTSKVTMPNKEGHETQCLLGWLARYHAQKRKQELDRLQMKPVEIMYKNTKSPSKKAKSKSSPNTRKSNREANGKHKRQEPPMRPCPECGEAVRETHMMGHLRNSCPKSRHAMKHKMSPRNGFQDESEATDVNVLFASWPGQNSGAPMDSTYFWKVVENHFYSRNVLEKKRMEQLSKGLCGVKLGDVAKASRKRGLQTSDIHCRDTMRLERDTEDVTQTLVLKKFAHKCDIFMRASHCRCLSDNLAKPMIEICHNPACPKPNTNPVGDAILQDIPEGAEADIRVQFTNGENTSVGCKFSMRVSRDGDAMNQHAADNGTFASSFQHDAVSTLAGFDMQTNKIRMAAEDKLFISLDTCDQPIQNGSVDETPQSNPQALSILRSPLTDGYTPLINLLMEHLKDTMEQNRFTIRSLYKTLQKWESDNNRFQLKAQTTDLYYREFASWKRLCASLLIGYKSGDHVQGDDKKTRKKTSKSVEQEGSTEDEDDAIDDGTCVVCFDGQSPETNPIIFCDRCELAVHQRCYGMDKVPSNEFICDRCRSTREGIDPARDVFCQLCSLSDGAFKRTVDGKWVHVVCALWCPNVWIGNLFELSEISLVGTTNQVRFVNSAQEIDGRVAQASSGLHISPKSGDHPEVPSIELGSLCVHCRVACGRTIQCCHPGCSTSFHPLCGWFDGLPMTISHGDERYLYAGGGAGLNFRLFCSRHLPEYYSASEQLTQRRRRARFRIDSFFVMRNKENYSTGAQKPADDSSSLLSGSIVQAVLSAENKMAATDNDPNATDWTDMTVCSACFEYCAPVVGELTDVNMLHRRQFMIRCQYCNVYIHPECCISDIGSSSTIFRSNWICEKCTQTGGKGAPACVVCAKATDYLMPCVDPPAPTNQSNGKALSVPRPTVNPMNTAIRPAPGGGQQLWLELHQSFQRQQQGQPSLVSKPPLQRQTQKSTGVAPHPSSSKWIHVYCSKWQKTRTVKRHHMLCAYTPTMKAEGMASRCELCDKKDGLLANCAQCYRRFHPICAAQKKLYCARSNRTDWKFYCEAHPPPDAAFDVNRQSWVTQEILSHLQDLRRSLERGRMLLEMSRQRDRQQKRLLNLCRLPLMEASIEVVLKKRPTAHMKEVYRDFTGETLTDVPHTSKPKAPPASPSNSRNRIRNSPRTAGGGRPTRAAKRSAAQAAATPERSPKRRRTRADSDVSSNGGHNSRRSSRQKSLRFNQEDSENEGEGADESENDEAEVYMKMWEKLAVPQDLGDFDLVVAENYPELVVRKMPSSNYDGLVNLFEIPVPPTAASMAETIGSTEEVHSCDEWNLFSDFAFDHGASDSADSGNCKSDDEADPLSASCVENDLQHAATDLRIDSVVVLERSQQDKTDRQDTAESVDNSKPDTQSLSAVDDESRSNIQQDRPNSRCDSSVNAMFQRIQVVVRVRPTFGSEGKMVVSAGDKEGISLRVQSADSQGSGSTVTECTFDRVFMGGATQQDVYAAVEPIVQACLEGYNSTIFVYGQTGTGKTHTLFGRDLGLPGENDEIPDSSRKVQSSWGIVPRTLNYLLGQTSPLKQKNCQVELHLSFLQIYNDRLFDLLTDRMRHKPLLIREQPTLEGTTSVTIQGLSSERISSFTDAMKIIHQGHLNRCVRETESNLSSSRSHAIVQLNVTTHWPAPSGEGQVLRRARLNLVDLAGSEKWNTDVEMEDVRSQELKNINTSLSALGNCIAALTETGRKHIPYRDSTLTRVLQDSLGGNTQSCLIATVNATQQSYDETIRTIQFADRARSVMQIIRVNEVADGPNELLAAKIQIVKLRERLDSEHRRSHEIRFKERQAMQRDFQEKLKVKHKEITKLTRENAVFQRWRDEDVKKIRALEHRVKDLEQQINVSNDRMDDSLTPVATGRVVQSRQHSELSTVQSTCTTMPKARSHVNLTRVEGENGGVTQTYKQVLERYTLESKNELQITTAQPSISKIAFSQQNSSYEYDTNQLEDPDETQLAAPDINFSMKQKPRQENCRSGGSSHISKSDDTPYQVSRLCAPPIVCHEKVAEAPISNFKSRWSYPNLGFSTEWTSPKLSKSMPTVSIQKPRAANEPRYSNPAIGGDCVRLLYTSVPRQDVSMLKSVRSGNFSYNSPTCIPVATCANEPCQKHKLTGCILCSVQGNFLQNQGTAFHKEQLANSEASKYGEVTRKFQDGPCERHTLLRCFICMKGSTTTNASQTAATSKLPSYIPPSKLQSYQNSTFQGDKCALHSLASCILCAGVKAMTRKTVNSQEFPATTVFDARNGIHADDRYRRYTVDERILNRQPG